MAGLFLQSEFLFAKEGRWPPCMSSECFAPVVKLDITADSDSAIPGSSPGGSILASIEQSPLWLPWMKAYLCFLTFLVGNFLGPEIIFPR